MFNETITLFMHVVHFPVRKTAIILTGRILYKIDILDGGHVTQRSCGGKDVNFSQYSTPKELDAIATSWLHNYRIDL